MRIAFWVAFVAAMFLMTPPIQASTYFIYEDAEDIDDEPLIWIEGVGFRRFGEEDCYSSKLGVPMVCIPDDLERIVRPKPRPCEPLPVCLLSPVTTEFEPELPYGPRVPSTPEIAVPPVVVVPPGVPGVPTPPQPPVFPPIVYPPVFPEPPADPEPPVVPPIPLPASMFLLGSALVALRFRSIFRN